MTEIFQPKKLWCQKGEADAEILTNGQIGYASEVCGACEYYTSFELEVNAEGTTIEKGMTPVRLVQLIQQTEDGPQITECTPSDAQVRELIDPIRSPLKFPILEKLMRSTSGV